MEERSLEEALELFYQVHSSVEQKIENGEREGEAVTCFRYECWRCWSWIEVVYPPGANGEPLSWSGSPAYHNCNH
ncbi:MAG: hypothetical protein HQL53_05570 [Magnetococcales bacterium]|nr:hypothetical protein [Magnetococcales bacterium]